MRLGTQTVDILHPTTIVDHGTEITDWTDATETPVEGCSVQPIGDEEILAHRDAVLAGWRAWLPPGTPITALDRVRHAGTVYEVVGEPQRWDDPYGGLSHVEVLLNRWEG